jgi:site-specific DNA-cytosine methylase
MFDDDKGKHQAGSVWDTDGLSPTLDTMAGGYREHCIVEDIKDDNVRWKDIEGFPYVVSSTGLVKNVTTGQLLNPSMDKDGYYYVTLYNNDEKKNKRVSRLVAEAFIPIVDNLPQVNHINGDIHNNEFTNLEWISSKSNCEHRDNVLLSIKKQGEPKGVSWDADRNKWVADIKYQNKTVHLGRFDDKKDAYKSVYYKYKELRGYAPWDENYHRTFSNENELFDEYNISFEISQRVNDYTTKPIYLGNTTPSGKSQCNAVYSTNGVSQTLCAGTHGYATGSILEESTKLDDIICDVEMEDISIEKLYRIRKLTPNECWLLMGLNKEDCVKAANLGISNSALYKIAGNGIVTNCIELIAEHLYKAQYDSTYICTDENFQNPKVN